MDKGAPMLYPAFRPGRRQGQAVRYCYVGPHGSFSRDREQRSRGEDCGVTCQMACMLTSGRGPRFGRRAGPRDPQKSRENAVAAGAPLLWVRRRSEAVLLLLSASGGP